MSSHLDTYERSDEFMRKDLATLVVCGLIGRRSVSNCTVWLNIPWVVERTLVGRAGVFAAAEGHAGAMNAHSSQEDTRELTDSERAAKNRKRCANLRKHCKLHAAALSAWHESLAAKHRCVRGCWAQNPLQTWKRDRDFNRSKRTHIFGKLWDCSDFLDQMILRLVSVLTCDWCIVKSGVYMTCYCWDAGNEFLWVTWDVIAMSCIHW